MPKKLALNGEFRNYWKHSLLKNNSLVSRCDAHQLLCYIIIAIAHQ